MEIIIESYQFFNYPYHFYQMLLTLSMRHLLKYRKILIISPGFILVQKAVMLDLFSGEIIFGGAYY